MAETIVDTRSGAVAFVEEGHGFPVLIVHGSPGGSDQGMLMGRFLVESGYRVIAPSRPGYLGTPLHESNGSASATADLLVGLMDTLGAERFGVVCWSGGGPSSYHLAAAHPERVSALVASAAVSGGYAFATGVASIGNSILSSGFGAFALHLMAKHTPKSLIASTVKEEGGRLSRSQVKELTEHIWEHEAKRDFVLALSATLSGRRAGLKNDQRRFPDLDPPLGAVRAPTLLVHGTADTDVPPEHSERAFGAVPGAQILRVDKGTHICVWTDPTCDAIQSRVIDHLR